MPLGGSAAYGGRPGKDRDRPREKLAGEAVSGKRGVRSGSAAAAVGCRVRLVAGGVPGVGTVGMAAVGVATATRLRSCVRRAVGRGCGCAPARMLPLGAATAVIVGDRGQEAGRQMHEQAQGHEAATHYASVKHVPRPHGDRAIKAWRGIGPGKALAQRNLYATLLQFIPSRRPGQRQRSRCSRWGRAFVEICSRPGFSHHLGGRARLGSLPA